MRIGQALDPEPSATVTILGPLVTDPTMHRAHTFSLLVCLTLGGGFVLLVRGEMTGGESFPSKAKLREFGAGGSKRIEPPLVEFDRLTKVDLKGVSVPLRHAIINREKARNLVQHEINPERSPRRPGIVLFRRLGQKEVEVIRTTAGMEDEAVAVLKRRAEIEFAALDTVQTRQFTPSDADVSVQWHHSSLGSFEAWEGGLGSSNVTIAIVDYPFQMDHADLAANVGAGWDVTDEMPILTAAGDAHSTGAAGLAAGVIQNGLGVAGIGNFRVVPIGITGAISEMYQAVLWAADHNIRVVNISWTGGGEEVLQAAGEYLEEQVQGLLVMPGLNGVGRLDLTNQPNVICVSMTDAADNARSASGPHIDFAAPGWDVYSTTTGNGYAIARGTSFSAPLFSGIAAAVMSINPALKAAQVLDVLRVTAIDKGSAGWDESFGWGRVHFGAAVDETLKTLPKITTVTREASDFRVTVQSAFPLQLALESSDRAAGGEWTLVDKQVATSMSTSFNDRPLTQAAFYRVRAESVQE